jgi:DNA-binding MarR family transcriptional regulator
MPRSRLSKVKMLDETAKKPLGAALLAATEAWRDRARAALAQRADMPSLGAGADLLQLIEPGGLTQSALTERAGLSKQAVQQLLDRLESGGLVRRETDAKDRRVKHVHLTEPGRRFCVERRGIELNLEAEAREKLGKKRFIQLRKALRKLAAPAE